jgi:hypothetical protein
VGKPVIWQEYRIHNIAFGLRSVICTFLAWLAVYKNQAPSFRRVAVVGSCLTALLTSLVADRATRLLRANPNESTISSMPYWEGCSGEKQERCKLFYAYAQFLATFGCIAVCNPAWGLAMLFAIQEASFLMTLVRKGLLSTKGSHIAYTIGLILPVLAALRGLLYVKQGSFLLPVMMIAAGLAFQLRRLGTNKYVLWIPVYAARILWGDRFIPYAAW